MSEPALQSVRPMFELKGKNFVVTGGAQGIGFAVTRAILEMGGNVVAMDIKSKPAGLDELAKEFGVKASFIQVDVTSEESLKAAFAKATEFLGTIDGCLPVAGVVHQAPFVEHSWAEFKRVQDVNVTGAYFTAQYAAKQMIKQGTGGSIILIASICAHSALPGHTMSAYNASKGAIKMLSTALAIELAAYNIRVNTISPGFIDSEMTQIVRDSYPKMKEIMFHAPPLQRIGTQNDLVGSVIYLLSDASTYTTAADIAITGGLHAGRIHQ